MSAADRFSKVPESPTHPRPDSPRKRTFDVADLYRGPLDQASDGARVALDEKLRQAYFWMVNQAIISPYYDVEYNDGPAKRFTFGTGAGLTLPSGQSYSSFVLLPLLNLAVRRRCLLVGGPGRGKTASAVLMGLLAGYDISEIRRAIQHGQPQMTVTDLLGNPLPKDLVSADSIDDIRISWRRWLSMRVKIIDEYNRIPTRTQSALLTVMADNYAEVLDQIYECPAAAWYLTANDDAGGGTYQVIEALRDRIDVVVKAPHFSPRFLGDLLARIEAGVRPEAVVPPQIVFTPEQLDQVEAEVLDVVVPQAVRRRLEFFASQFEFCDPAASQFEYKTKDTVKLSGVAWHLVTASDTGRDRVKDIGSTSRNGLSVRSLMTILVFVKAMAWFRGQREVSLDDLRQILPFVLHDKLVPDHDSPFFDADDNGVLRIDRVGWIRRLFDLSCDEYDRLLLDVEDPVAELQAAFARGLEGVSEADARQRLVAIENQLTEWSRGGKLYGHLYDDILKLKYLHQRYTNYLAWLQWAQ
ncbi:MAG: AAA family ATPase [Myxococcales bacterium]|nr:AAA family ATPase [Myxococcales bacterium]